MRLKAKVVGCELSRRSSSRTVAKELLDLQSSEIVIPTFILFPGCLRNNGGSCAAMLHV